MTQIRPKPWLLFTLIGALVAVSVFGVDRYRRRFVRSNAQMVALLPPRGTKFFVDVAVLRRANLLSLLSDPKRVEEMDYSRFVHETGFDYARDADAIAGSVESKQMFVVVRGRFHWSDIRQYAADHGGSCTAHYCKLPASKREYSASVVEIQPDVLGLALSEDPSAATMLVRRRGMPSEQIPAQPVWVKLSRSLLENPVNLPLPARILTITLQSADTVTLALDRGESADATFEVHVNAEFPNQAAADTARRQLEIQTKLFQLELAREHEQASASNLSGLFVSGRFQAVGNRLSGSWPVKRELLEALR
ncbi:MAG: hypothetical protein JOZ62_19835 [Acidobacteriaceae bacterium]|nr:hypothetical protein [Acidobacteriaceae bacterium]